MNREENFWNKMAQRYSKSPVADEESYQKKLKISQSYFKPDMEVLEFGCGTGSTALTHAPFVKHILATDISDRMLEIAQDKAAVQGIKNVTFEHVTIENLDITSESLDVVLGLSILHLVENKDKVISKVYEMLKPNGIFITSTACLGDFMPLLKIILPIGQFLGLIPLVKLFTSDNLKKSLISSGFEIDYYWQPGKNKAVFIVARKSSK